jgi:hypothetical protein
VLQIKPICADECLTTSSPGRKHFFYHLPISVVSANFTPTMADFNYQQGITKQVSGTRCAQLVLTNWWKPAPAYH